jgi:hypothetical protein
VRHCSFPAAAKAAASSSTNSNLLVGLFLMAMKHRMMSAWHLVEEWQPGRPKGDGVETNHQDALGGCQTLGRFVKVTRGEECMKAILRIPQERPTVCPNTLGFGIPQLSP